MATVTPLLERQLGLSPDKMGWLLSAFYVTYVLAMIPAGWLAERYGAKLILGIGFAIWSGATLLTGLCSTFVALLACRLLLGIGESATFPCMSKLIASVCRPGQIGRANGLTAFGYLMGPAVGTYVGSVIMVHYGWRPTFWIFGALALLWIWPWLRTPAPEVRLATTPAAGPSLKQLLSQRALWASSLGHFAGNYTFYFVLSWLPDYLARDRGMSIASMGTVAGIAYLLNAAGALGAGYLADWRLRAGGSAGRVYKSLMALNHVAAIGCMLGMASLPTPLAVACLFTYELIMGLASPGCFAVSQILAGPSASARWVGIQNMCGNLAGIFAPAITGYLLGSSGNFTRAFAIAAFVNLLGILGWIILMPRIEPIRWQAQPALI